MQHTDYNKRAAEEQVYAEPILVNHPVNVNNPLGRSLLDSNAASVFVDWLSLSNTESEANPKNNLMMRRASLSSHSMIIGIVTMLQQSQNCQYGAHHLHSSLSGRVSLNSNAPSHTNVWQAAALHKIFRLFCTFINFQYRRQPYNRG